MEQRTATYAAHQEARPTLPPRPSGPTWLGVPSDTRAQALRALTAQDKPTRTCSGPQRTTSRTASPARDHPWQHTRAALEHLGADLAHTSYSSRLALIRVPAPHRTTEATLPTRCNQPSTRALLRKTTARTTSETNREWTREAIFDPTNRALQVTFRATRKGRNATLRPCAQTHPRKLGRTSSE